MKVPSEALAFRRTAQALDAQGEPGWRVPEEIREAGRPSKPLLRRRLSLRSPAGLIALCEGSLLRESATSGSDVFDRSHSETGGVPGRRILGEAEAKLAHEGSSRARTRRSHAIRRARREETGAG